ncbi:MAG: helix-turn-helix transcriptional regulator [Synergistaceae bacterium]|nr:helix-turn-helix transcriptional regulator [Synergistaceae bacterium]
MKGMGELRRKLGLTQAELAEKAGVGVNTIARYERGEMEPSLKVAHAIANVLGCTEAELLNGPAKQEFEVKIVMGVKSLTGLAGVEVASNSFIYGVDDSEPQIVLAGKVLIGTPEERETALAEIIRKFKAACWMFDHKAAAEAES